MNGKRIAFGSDQQAELTDKIIEYLQNEGYELQRYGALGEGSDIWSDVALTVAQKVASGEVDEGILCCWTGTGVTIMANKVKGVRAALCDDAETARGARLWNKGNLLCLSLRRSSYIVGLEIVKKWLDTTYQPNERDDLSIGSISQVESSWKKE